VVGGGKVVVIAELMYAIVSPFTQHHYDVTVFYFATLLLLHGFNPYDVPRNAPWIYSNPVTYPQWYAYPPLGLIAFAIPSLVLKELGLLNIFTFRLIEKSIVIVSAVWAAKRIDEIIEGRGKLFLMNPLVFFATAVHGMIDSLAVALFVESLYRLLKNKRLWWLFYGLSLATKQISWITLPALLGYSLRRGRSKEYALGLAVFVVVLLPFFSKGFIENVLTFHSSRPPASLGYTGIPLIMVAGDAATFHIANIVAPCFGKPLPKAGWGSVALLAAFVISLVYSTIVAYRGKLMKALAVASIAFILFSKIVSPQNLILPLAVFEIMGISPKILYFFGTLAATVDAVFGTAYSILGYLAEDVLNAFGTSIVILYRENLWIARASALVGLVALVLYHISVVVVLYLIMKNKLSKRMFIGLYVLYVVLVLNSVAMSHSMRVAERNVALSSWKGAAIWVWLNPYNGLRGGDYAFLKGVNAYWEYTYPLALETVKWLKDHGYTYVALVYSVDRSELYSYVPWLFALASNRMPFVWLVVLPNSTSDYLHGYASVPKKDEVLSVLNKVYRMTPIYLNSKINEVESKVVSIVGKSKLFNITSLKVITSLISACPIPYVTVNGKAIIFVKGINKEIVGRGFVALPAPRSLVEINDYYKDHVVWGTPITPTRKETVLSWMSQYGKKSSLNTLLWLSR